jgi:hypothetical protein
MAYFRGEFFCRTTATSPFGDVYTFSFMALSSIVHILRFEFEDCNQCFHRDWVYEWPNCSGLWSTCKLRIDRKLPSLCPISVETLHIALSFSIDLSRNSYRCSFDRRLVHFPKKELGLSKLGSGLL